MEGIVLLGAFQCIAIQGARKLAEPIFMGGCECLSGVGWEGLEPSTNALKGRCSTIELPTRAGKIRYILFGELQP